MSPRPYRLGQRQAATDETRARILAAAQELLTAREGFAGFTVDAVARQAGVARMTVYYQFGSKVGLLEGVCDALAVRGGIEQMAGAFQQPKALGALAEFIGVLGRFFEAERPLIRRLQGLAALDPDIEQVVRARGERRRHGLEVLLRRLSKEHGRPTRKGFTEALEILFTLTSFETFDTLAGPKRGTAEVAPLVRRLALMALGLEKA
jgi:AcrR family transcriptional regulator